jgi:hypothetical protein
MNQGSNSRSAGATPYRRQEGDLYGSRTSLMEYHLEDDKDDQNGIPEGEVRLLDVYEYRQKYGYLLNSNFVRPNNYPYRHDGAECGVAPIRIDPMVGPYPDALSKWGAQECRADFGKRTNVEASCRRPWYMQVSFIWSATYRCNLRLASSLKNGAVPYGCSFTWLVPLGLPSFRLASCPMSYRLDRQDAVIGYISVPKYSEIFCRSCESRVSVQEKVGHAIRKHRLWQRHWVVPWFVNAVQISIPFVDWAARLGGLLTGITVGLMVFSCYVGGLVWRCIWFVARSDDDHCTLHKPL